jgi:hypothetical protein
MILPIGSRKQRNDVEASTKAAKQASRAFGAGMIDDSENRTMKFE